MFFYLSFLRPPPTQAPLSSPILITPQISNDLRTEPFLSVQDLYYSWLQEPEPRTARNVAPKGPVFTQPTKLTTYRQATAYKEIPVPLPKNLREGQQWRLILMVQNRMDILSIDLGKEDIGAGIPFPVLSMPILFTARAGRWAPKQEQIERLYRFSVARPELPSVPDGGQPSPSTAGPSVQNVALRIREQTSFDLDKKIWDSGIGLSSWLVKLAESSSTGGFQLGQEGSALRERLKEIILNTSRQRILELGNVLPSTPFPYNMITRFKGAGIGIVALVLSVLRANFRATESAEERDEILTTDLDSAIPLLEHNIATNQRFYPSVELKAGVLNWEEDYISQVKESGPKFDLVVMADVTYNTSSFPALVQTLKSILQANEEKKPLIVLGYKQRDESERSLWEMAKEIGIDFVPVGEVPGYGEAPIEIWIA
ncbi:hypothetical protein CC1G_05701 [Coprinopsis cinerea okayama7|uniref:Uncharacterized protein n=1 Tax=Coprinopsis cinerea (strain Okayama-7 / 130 / ATCC MYA-4618 / FGSC 9003) TaxID=240176 RepID=A8N9X4_COPC7|nr:hypothetical protein CC1G_05701 [Coprinopsis cinerea okayama7\|eukprot:XP_001831630.2 hypothetical protein CC1G_05701 [Coprinopsis cinerea okayama7\